MDTSVLELGLANLRRARSAVHRDVELLERLDSIADRVAEVAEECSALTQAMLRPEPVCSPPQPFFDRLLGRGVAVSTIWSRARGYRPEANGTHYADGLLAELPVERLLVFDRSVAFVAVPGVPVTQAALFVRGTSLVRPYARIFDRAEAGAARDVEPRALSAAQRRVLAMLRDGHRDTEIASALGVTDRTVRRHVRALHRHSGTRTRFELGAWSGARPTTR